MSLARLLAIARKELRHIYRDPQIFFMVVIAPAFVLFLLAYVFAVDTDTLRIGVMDLDHTPSSRQVVQALAAGEDLQVVRYVRDYEEVARLLTRGEAVAALVIPHGFHTSMVAGRPEPLQAVIDGSDYFLARTTYSDLAARVAAVGQRLLSPAAAAAALPLAVQTRTLYNITGKWLFAMVPGLMAAALCFPAIAVALAYTREVERGSYEGILSTPMRIPEYLLGKLLPYLVTGMLGAILAWGLALVWFRVPFRGTMGNYLGLTLLFMLALMSMSMLVGATAAVQRHAIILVIVIFFIPTFFMSGLLVPLDPERPLARIIKVVLPAANYVLGNRAVFLKSLGLVDLWPEVRNLLGITLVSLLAGHILARRKVA